MKLFLKSKLKQKIWALAKRICEKEYKTEIDEIKVSEGKLPWDHDYDPKHEFDHNGKHVIMWDENYIASALLKEEILFVNTREYVCPYRKTIEKNTIVCFLSCNDVFAWATADVEPVTCKDLPELWVAWKTDPKWGIVKWTCIRRNEKPQKPIEKDMRSDGAWDDVMEALPANWEDNQAQLIMAKAIADGKI